MFEEKPNEEEIRDNWLGRITNICESGLPYFQKQILLKLMSVELLGENAELSERVEKGTIKNEIADEWKAIQVTKGGCLFTAAITLAREEGDDKFAERITELLEILVGSEAANKVLKEVDGFVEVNKHAGMICPYKESCCSLGVMIGEEYVCRGYGMSCPEEQ